MQTPAELVMKSLVDSYNLIKSLSDKINQIESRTSSLPWENNSQRSYKTPEPTPAIENLATSMIRQMAHVTFNDTMKACKQIFTAHDKVVIWKNGVVTTLGESIDTKNPLAIFRSRACARISLRKAGYKIAGAHESGGYSTLKYIIASR